MTAAARASLHLALVLKCKVIRNLENVEWWNVVNQGTVIRGNLSPELIVKGNELNLTTDGYPPKMREQPSCPRRGDSAWRRCDQFTG